MRKIILTSLMIVFTLPLSAQVWVGLGGGGNLSHIDFQNSQGIKDNSLRGAPSVYVSIYGQSDVSNASQPKSKGSKAASLLSFEFGYKRTQIRDRDNTILSKWTLDYLVGSVGFRRLIPSQKIIAPFVETGVTMDYLLSGIQQNSFQQYDLTTKIRATNMSVYAGGGIIYNINHDVIGTLGLTYQYGLSNLEEDNQTSRISSFKLGLGLFFLIR